MNSRVDFATIGNSPASVATLRPAYFGAKVSSKVLLKATFNCASQHFRLIVSRFVLFNCCWYFIPWYFEDGLSGLPATNYGSEAIVDTGHFQNRRFPRIDGATLNNSVTFAQTLVDRLSTLERNIANAGIALREQSPAQKQFWNSYPTADAFERGIDAIVATKASSYLVHQNCRRYVLFR